MPRTAEDIEADIATVNSNLLKLADPDRVERLKKGDREIQRRSGDQAETSLRRRLRELKAELARVCGQPSPLRTKV